MEGGAVTARVLGMDRERKELKILGIHGSPRGAKSRTRMLVQWVLEGAEATGATTELMDLASLRIEACNACESCSLTGQCVYNDDFFLLYERMIAADGIVLGSPVYIDNVTGQMKVFIDRLADAIHYQTLSGKYGCAVTTTWSSGGEDVVLYLNHVFNYLGILALKGISVAIEDDPEAIYREEEKALKLGARLAGAIRMQEKFPGQASIIEENRSFFARIVEQNREWRPDEYKEWVRKGWIN
ncbi:MAG: flavodoxin family protein [Methanoregulaceae archaeon]|nr:flavodoxin family protein [Methanoregulaceae archaeon]